MPAANAADAVELPLITLLEEAPPPLSEDGAAVDGWEGWTADRLAERGVDGSETFKLHAQAPSLVLLTTLRSLLAGVPVRDPASLTCTGCSGVIGGFGEGDDDALAAQTLRAVAAAAKAEAQRMAAGSAESADGDSTDEARSLLLALRSSRLALLAELDASMTKLAERFESGGGAAASARVLLECAVMEAEPKPYPIAPRMLDQWCGQAWDWESGTYA